MATYTFNKYGYGNDTFILEDSKAARGNGRIFYGTCSTAAGTTTKDVVCEDFTSEHLVEGATIFVKFSTTNSGAVASLKLNVNNTGAKTIQYMASSGSRANLSSVGKIQGGCMYQFYYDGTYWIMHATYNSNTTYTNASLGQGIGTCSTAEATTEKVVTLSDYALTTGGVVIVSFTYAVPAGSTLKINSKTAKPIYYRGSAITDGIIKAGDRATFIYSGSYYHLLTVDRSAKTATTDVDGLMSAADKLKLDNVDYVTPQMFGAIVDDNIDDTAAIQAALDTSLNVYFPKGTYTISAPLVIRNHAHIWGCGQNSTIKASDTFSIDNFNCSNENINAFVSSHKTLIGNYIICQLDGTQSNTAYSGTFNDKSNVNIEHIKLHCNNIAGGIRIIRAYNDSVIRDVIVDYIGIGGIYVGDETPKANSNVSSLSDSEYTKSSRSQTLVVDNCYFAASTSVYHSRPLCYFFNCLELNLKDTKMLASSARYTNQPCLTLKNGTDAYVRGCSFAHTGGEAIRVLDYTKYFRFIGNTYENLGTEKDEVKNAYIRSGATALSSNWLSETSGGSALTPSVAKIYKIAATVGTYTAGSYYYWNDTTSQYTPTSVRDYAIALLGSSDEAHTQGLGKVLNGIIIETMYANVPKGIKFSYA